MRKIKTASILLACLTVAGLSAAGILGLNFLAAGSPVPSLAALSCPVVAPVRIGKITVPSGPIAGYCQDRLENAAHIMNAARALGIGTHTQTIGVMTAIGESGLRVLNYGDSTGADSRGLFQQRDNGAWGTLADRMDPFMSATNFFRRLTGISGWKNMSPSLAAHTVQVNADPNHYAPYWADAQTIVAALITG